MSENNCEKIRELATALADVNMKVCTLVSSSNHGKFEQKSIRFMKAVNDYMQLLEEQREFEEKNVDSQ